MSKHTKLALIALTIVTAALLALATIHLIPTTTPDFTSPPYDLHNATTIQRGTP